MKIIYKHKVTVEINEVVRASDYILRYFPYFETKSSVKKALKNERIYINGEICTSGTHIKKGQLIELFQNQEVHSKVFKFPLNIIFEDDYFGLINKPAGLSVSGNYFKTVQNALIYNLKISNQSDGLKIPLPVHRLDNQTSGLLLIAKTRKTRVNLGRQFEEKTVLKKYTAVVIGKPEKKGIINLPIDDKEAITKYESIRTEKSLRNGYLSLLNLFPLTGRTHQLRIHCMKAGFPILGDKLYHNESLVFKGKGLFLSATEITFKHPNTEKQMVFKIPYPEKFNTLIEREKRRFFMIHPKK